LLGVSGGIAAYKGAEIIRRLADQGVSVQVIMTANATRFITPLTLATLSGRPVWIDEFPERIGTPREGLDPVAHIHLAEQADALVIAPATANTIAKIALGIADNLLTSTVLAWRGPSLIAPAMNYRMYEDEATQANLGMLAKRGWISIDPEEGWLACGEVGRGRLASPERIASAVLAALAKKDGPLSGKRVLVTAGGTREALDPVRFISNSSSGTLALKCAVKLALEGAEIELICGTGVDERALGEIPCRLTRVTTANEMRTAVETKLPGCAALLMLAAVADYAPKAAPQKIKKEASASLSLQLARTEDILQGLPDIQGLVKVGVSLETDDAADRAKAKLLAKRLDAIVAVEYRAGENPYGDSEIRAGLITGDGEQLPLAPLPKDELAGAIIHLTNTLIANKETAK
jgi:phosphopantothenoylcysteine decarboxylase/phosphopantothenate--cysteine ligase